MSNRWMSRGQTLKVGSRDPKELGNPESRNYNWKDGLYAIEYFLDGQFLGRQCEALAVLRDGAVLASDEMGGVLEGRLVTSACGSVHCALFMLRLPPGVFALAGLAAGPRELVVDVSGFFDKSGDDLCGRIEVEGLLLEVVFRYIGSLPSSVSVA